MSQRPTNFWDKLVALCKTCNSDGNNTRNLSICKDYNHQIDHKLHVASLNVIKAVLIFHFHFLFWSFGPRQCFCTDSQQSSVSKIHSESLQSLFFFLILIGFGVCGSGGRAGFVVWSLSAPVQETKPNAANRVQMLRRKSIKKCVN